MALNIIEKHFDAWQVLLLKTCSLKKMPIPLPAGCKSSLGAENCDCCLIAFHLNSAVAS